MRRNLQTGLAKPVKLLAERLASNDPAAVEELYGILLDRLRPQLHFRVGGNAADDLLHETVAIVIESIQSNLIRDPNSILAFSHGVARRLAAAWILGAMRSRKRMVSMDQAAQMFIEADSPESRLLERERNDLLEKGLRKLQSRDSELLTRFYFDGQPLRQICAEMGLTETQFRLFKSRAKAKLMAWARQRD